MAHLATMMQGVGGQAERHDFQKTVAINDFYLRGPDTRRIRSARFSRRAARTASWRKPSAVDGAVDAARSRWGARGVRLARDDRGSAARRTASRSTGRPDPLLHYAPTTCARTRELVEETKRILRRLGFWSSMTHSLGDAEHDASVRHAVFGTDPRTSVLDPFCRTHDVENLFVVDASFFPSSAAVNPGLTIAAQALRVADPHHRRRDLQ